MPRKSRRPVAAANPVTVTPLFADRTLPLLIRPNLEDVDLLSWIANHKTELTAKLLDAGAILFRGFGMTAPEQLDAVVRTTSGEPLEYKERSTPRSAVAGNIYTATDYPASQRIFPHNENSYQAEWPMKLFFQCAVAPDEGGETPLVDTRKVLADIDPDIRRRFETRDFLIVRNFSSDMGLTWPQVFGTGDRDAVQAYCKRRGIQCEWKTDGGLRTRTRRRAVVNHPQTGVPCWFNHGTFFHVTSLDPSIAETVRRTVPEEELPSNTYYGDGTPIEDEVLAHLRTCYMQNAVVFAWQRGDLLLLDNMLTAHARRPFKGDRKVLVAMAEPLSQLSEEMGS